MVNPPPIELGTLGMSDTLILMVLALVVFGPRRLPQIGRQIGKLMYEFRKASNDFKFQMEEELRLSEEADRRKKQEAEQARLQALNPPAAQTVESQAAIGGQESVSAPSHPLYGSSSGYPEQYPPEVPAAVEGASETVPRIQPPSTGAPVAARQGSERQGPRDQETEGPSIAAAQETQETVVAETNLGADAASTGTLSPAESQAQSDPTPTETMTQHG